MSDLKTLLQQFLSPSFSASGLSKITDWPTLSKMRKNATNSQEEILIDAQMEKALHIILPGFRDWGILLNMRDNAPAGSTPEEMIDNHMSLILPDLLMDVSDWLPLVELLDNILPDSEQEQFVVRRMEEVLRHKLPRISAWNILADMHADAPLDTPPERLIEQRMAELVDAITLENTPEWFTDYIASPNTIPFHLVKHISFKAHELLAQL